MEKLIEYKDILITININSNDYKIWILNNSLGMKGLGLSINVKIILKDQAKLRKGV